MLDAIALRARLEAAERSVRTVQHRLDLRLLCVCRPGDDPDEAQCPRCHGGWSHHHDETTRLRVDLIHAEEERDLVETLLEIAQSPPTRPNCRWYVSAKMHDGFRLLAGPFLTAEEALQVKSLVFAAAVKTYRRFDPLTPVGILAARDNLRTVFEVRDGEVTTP